MFESNNQNEYKEKEEIEAYFRDAKKKTFPIGMLFVIFILLIIGGCFYYYFIIDSPKNLFLTIIKDKFNGIKLDDTTYNIINYDYSFDINIETSNKEYLDIINILNQISITGHTDIDIKNKKNYTILNTLYQEKDLFGFEVYSENSNNIYLKLNNIYDKVIKSKIENKEDDINNTIDEISSKKIITSLTNAIIDTSKNADYLKEYTTLNDNIVKKITLTINKQFKESFYNNLLNDKDFITNYSKYKGITEEEVKEIIKKEKSSLGEETGEISLYLSILKNEFIMLDISSDNDKVTITKENDKYNYKIYTDSIIEYQGYISIISNNNDYKINITHEDIEEELSFEINFNISYEYDNNINSLDTNNAIDYEDLTEEDMNQIMLNLMKNNVIMTLIEDINNIFLTNNIENKYYQTT